MFLLIPPLEKREYRSEMIMKYVVTHLVAGLLAVFLTCSLSHAEYWNLPTTLTDLNTEVGFAVDSTWHMVNCRTPNITGKAWLEDPADSNSIRVTLSIPVATFETDDRACNKRLLSCMDEKNFKHVSAEVLSAQMGCTAKEVVPGKNCEGTFTGALTIRDITKQLSIPFTLKKVKDDYVVSGKFPLRWAEYGVDDPSVFLVSHVDETAEVKFSVTLEKKF